jgi:hypothetical protein
MYRSPIGYCLTKTPFADLYVPVKCVASYIVGLKYV